MKVSLVSPYSSIANIGLRSISAVLKEKGHEVQMCFLPVPSLESSWNLSPNFEVHYPDALMEELRELTKDSRVIGLSLMSNYREVGIRITEALKRPGNTIAWGGAYPTLYPEDALSNTDVVCIGDGEEAMAELVSQIEAGTEPDNIPNLWFKGKAYPRLKAIEDISALPLADFGPQGHFVYNEQTGALVPLHSFDDYRNHFERRRRPSASGGDEMVYVFRLETSRGCPHNCTYCQNNVLKKVQSKTVRIKGLDRMKRELDMVRELFPFVKVISIEDDTFTARKDVRELVKLVKDSGFQFRCLVSPLYASEELVASLVENGLIIFTVGLQTRAPKTEKLYNRSALNRGIDDLFELFAKKYPDMPVLVDLIIDNPWETTEDRLYTLNFLLDKLPPKGLIGMNSLVIYPNTTLWEKASADGISSDFNSLKTWHWHRQPKIRYTTLVYFALKIGLPRGLVRFLESRPFLFLFERDLFTNFVIPKTTRLIKRSFMILSGRKTVPK